MNDARYVFVCPVCGKGSASQVDAEDGYCGLCRAQTGIPVRLSVGPVSGIIGHLARDPKEPVGDRLTGLLRECAKAFADLAAAVGEPHPPTAPDPADARWHLT